MTQVATQRNPTILVVSLQWLHDSLQAAKQVPSIMQQCLLQPNCKAHMPACRQFLLLAVPTHLEVMKQVLAPALVPTVPPHSSLRKGTACFHSREYESA